MKKEDIDVFFDWEGVELWEEVDELLLDAIVGYTPIVGKDLSKKTEQFERRKNWIVYDYTFTRVELFHKDDIDLNG